MSIERASEYLYIESGGNEDQDVFEEEDTKESISSSVSRSRHDDGETCMLDILVLTDAI